MSKLAPRLLLLGGLLMGLSLSGCSSPELGFRNTVPVVGITSPEDGQVVNFGDAIQFEGTVQDKQDAANSLDVVWESSIDGEIDSDAADATGFLLFTTSTLSGGDHVITLTATDTQGESAVASVNVTVVGGGAGNGIGEPPTVSLDNPVDGSTILQSDAVTILGLVWDEDQDPGTLEASLVSSRDGGLWVGSPDEFGRVEFETTGLSVGMHTLRLDAIDADDNRNSDQVQVEVIADARPGVIIEEPGEGDWFWNTDTIRFEGRVTDDVDHPQDLSLRWVSSIDGVLSAAPANPTGSTIIDATLSAGFHTIGLTAVDSDGNEATYSMTLEVRDPLDHDGDLDGYTENEGDCNDADPYTHPAAAEVCDARDNDCDGDVNEDDWDDLEFNDTLETATDLGDIDDAWIFGSGETASAGITLHSAYDEDWLVFYAGDDWGIDNVNIDVSVGPFPFTGDFVVELYQLDDSSTVPVDIDSGTGRLSVQFEGDVWDGSEDNFAIRVYADSWPSGSCGERFEIEIIDL